MKCRKCGKELVFVFGAGGNVNLPKFRVFHKGINLHDRDLFSAGSRIEDPSLSTQYRLRRQLEEVCDEW